MGSTQMYSLSWGEFSTCLSSTVQILRGHGELVDVTLAAGGRIFPAHKLVLSAASPLLMELLKSTGCQHPVVMLAGVTAHDLEALLEFVYMGEVSIDPSQLPSLLQAAHCLDIQALSSASLTSEKSDLHTSVGVCTDDGLPRDGNSPLHPVRKRKRKQRRTSENGLPGPAKWPHMDSTSENMENSISGCIGHPMDIKDEPTGTDENSPPPLGGIGRGRISASDQPRDCPLCGLVIRQARNLRRHIATACKYRSQEEAQVIELDPGDILSANLEELTGSAAGIDDESSVSSGVPSPLSSVSSSARDVVNQQTQIKFEPDSNYISNSLPTEPSNTPVTASSSVPSPITSVSSSARVMTNQQTQIKFEPDSNFIPNNLPAEPASASISALSGVPSPISSVSSSARVTVNQQTQVKIEPDGNYIPNSLPTEPPSAPSSSTITSS